MNKWGFGLSRKEILSAVQCFVKENELTTPFRDGKPGEDWFLNFMKRHRLSIKKPELIEASRVRQQSDPFIIYDFFDKVETILNDKGLQERPNSIWNADETAFNYDPRSTKVVTAIGEIAQRQTGGSGRKTTTVLACVNANGSKMPPMILHKGKRLWDNMFGSDEYPDTSYYVSENGWMTEQVFFLWFKNIFLKFSSDRPLLLIYDGHLSHISPELIDLAIQEDVTILKLPPHTSAMLQPLDVAVFKGLKSSWDCLLTDWQRRNVGKQLSKCDFSNLLGKAWNSINESAIISGFRKTGIYPLNKQAIPEDRFEPERLKRFQEERQKQLTTVDTEVADIQLNTDIIATTSASDRKDSPCSSASWEKILLSAVKPATNQGKKRERE